MLSVTNDKNPKELKYKSKDFKYFTDYSIGFLTRGCFRQCDFCVNRNAKTCVKHSPIHEFFDKSKPKICFLDDNFFACKDWRQIISQVKATGKKFQFKQGLDIKLLTDERIHELMTWSYDAEFIFAFDDITDKGVIECKLRRIFELYPNFKKRMKFYVLCGYDPAGKYDNDFWLQDIENTFERCRILAKYSALPYIMRYDKYKESPHAGIYTYVAAWANQASFYKKTDFATYCKLKGISEKVRKEYKRDFTRYLADGGTKGASWRFMESFASDYPEIADRYFHTVPYSLVKYGSDVKYAADNIAADMRIAQAASEAGGGVHG